MLSDTVGFIRDLPHDLVAAFRATLAEAAEADLLLHVIDASAANRDEQIEAVDAVLAEIGAADVPQIRVYNKIDVDRHAGRASSATAVVTFRRVRVSAVDAAPGSPNCAPRWPNASGLASPGFRTSDTPECSG